MKKMIDNEKAMKLLQVADKVDFESDEMVIEGKLDVNGKISANNGVELAEGTILTVPSASNVFIKDEGTNLDQELYAKQDKLVSGTNIKTINGNSVLGSGNITIDSGTAYTAGYGINISGKSIELDSETKWARVSSAYLHLPAPFLPFQIKFYNSANEYMIFQIPLSASNTDISNNILYLFNSFTGGTYTSFAAVYAAAQTMWTSQSAYRQKLAVLFALLPYYFNPGPAMVVIQQGETGAQILHPFSTTFDMTTQSGACYLQSYDGSTTAIIELTEKAAVYSNFELLSD